MLIRAGKIAAIVVGTYILGAFMLGGRERLRVSHLMLCSLLHSIVLIMVAACLRHGISAASCNSSRLRGTL